MPVTLEADRDACDSYVQRKMRAFLTASAVVVPILVAILLVEHRVILLGLMLLVFPLAPLGLALGLRKQVGRGGAVALVCREHDVELVIRRIGRRDGHGEASYREAAPGRPTTLADAEIAVVAHPDALVLVRTLPSNRFERIIVPAPEGEVTAVATLLARRGVTVKHEPGTLKVATFLGAVVLRVVLVVLAAGCVAGALASIGLAAVGRGGSYLAGAGLLTAALVLMTLVALLRRADHALR